MIHELKTLKPYFDALAQGNKTYEVRKTDCDFNVGDFLALNEITEIEKVHRALLLGGDHPHPDRSGVRTTGLCDPISRTLRDRTEKQKLRVQRQPERGGGLRRRAGMKKLITRITASLGYLLAALGVMLATPGLILMPVADSILEWIEKKNVRNMTDAQRRNYYGYGRKW